MQPAKKAAPKTAKLVKNNHTPIDWDDLISESEVLEKLKVHKQTLLRMRANGILRFTSFQGRHIMYSKSEIVTLLNS